jgi:hypothetical protein
MSDRLDDTLRDLARADAPADLSVKVQGALELKPRAALTARWPKLAAAAAVAVLLAVGGWLASDRGGGASAPHVGRVVPPAVDRGAFISADATADKEAPLPQSTVQVATRAQAPPRAPRVPPADHEHALPSLADIAAVGPAALSTPPMRVEATVIAPLAPIAPMDIPALDAGEGERR